MCPLCALFPFVLGRQNVPSANFDIKCYIVIRQYIMKILSDLWVISFVKCLQLTFHSLINVMNDTYEKLSVIRRQRW